MTAMYRTIAASLSVVCWALLLSHASLAAPVIRVEDVGAGVGVVIADQGAGDSNPLPGAVTFIGSVGQFSLNVATGQSMPVMNGLDLADLSDIALQYWHVMDSGRDSVDLLSRLLDRFGHRVNYVLVRNQLRGTDFGLLEKSGQLERAVALGAKAIDIKHLHVGEDAIPVELVLSGTHSGTWFGMPATGRHFEMPACAVFIFDEDDRIIGERGIQ